MNEDLIRIIIIIENELINEYNLSAEEAAICMKPHIDNLINKQSEDYIEIFLHTSYKTWAKRMYEYYKSDGMVPKLHN